MYLINKAQSKTSDNVLKTEVEIWKEHENKPMKKEGSVPLKEEDNKVVKLVVSHYEDGLLADTWNIIKGWECYQLSKSKSGKEDVFFPESRHAIVIGFTPFDWFRETKFNQGTRFESYPDEVSLKIRYFDNNRSRLTKLHQVKQF